jgi:hypothetical protein
MREWASFTGHNAHAAHATSLPRGKEKGVYRYGGQRDGPTAAILIDSQQDGVRLFLKMDLLGLNVFARAAPPLHCVARARARTQGRGEGSRAKQPYAGARARARLRTARPRVS